MEIKKMNRVIKTLMNRDSITEQEASDMVVEAHKEISKDPMNADFIMRDYLGLELDYLPDVLNYRVKL